MQHLGSSNALLITTHEIFLKAFVQTGLDVNAFVWIWQWQTTTWQIPAPKYL